MRVFPLCDLEKGLHSPSPIHMGLGVKVVSIVSGSFVHAVISFVHNPSPLF